jgi:Ribonuclease G/E
MSQRRLYLDTSAGERRGVVTLDGRPERLMIERDGDLASQALGARMVARVRRVENAAAIAFLDLGSEPDAVLNLTPEIGRLTEGQALEVEIRAEARGDKGANVQYIGLAQAPVRLLTPAPPLEERLRAHDRTAEIQAGSIARTVADGAQEEALATIFPLPGGGSIAVETTRALVAIDVDVGARAGSEAKRVARAANFAALGAAARVLRLKGLGGLVVIDLVGRGHDAPALLSAARAAFGADNPGVALGSISRFGTLELTIPRRSAPVLDRLVDAAGVMTALTLALDAVRTLEREAVADRGGRFELLACPEVAEAASPLVAVLAARLGDRLGCRGVSGRSRESFEVERR